LSTEAAIPLTSGESIHADIDGDSAVGTVLFVHGSGSSRHSPRNQRVARFLVEAGFSTVLLDLLTESEDRQDRMSGQHRFDIGLLTQRVVHALNWLREEKPSAPIGLFGASTGAAAALRAAAQRSENISAVVSRGGRPDLAGESLRKVSAPTLLIVGSRDHDVLRLNRQALEQLHGDKSLEVVAGAGHLFEEPGALDRVSTLAADWFRRHLSVRSADQ
jgi:putative phosphoribosyl transferase